MTSITWSIIFSSALIDSINPCAFAVLIFLIMYLNAIKNRRTMLVIGAVYIFMIYVVYFLAGLGLLSFVSSVHISNFFYIFTATLSIFFGLINIKNGFFDEKPFLAIPESKKIILQKYIKKATLPAALILGVLVAIFELPCTGGVYLAILSLLADKSSYSAAVVYLLFYNLIFILPLILILLSVYFGLPPEKFEKWRQGKKRVLRLFLGLFLVGLGLLMFFI